MQKNLSLILNVVLIIAVAYLYFVHFSGKKAAESATEPTTSTADTVVRQVPTDSLISSVPVVDLTGLPTNNTVYLNVDTLYNNYEYYKKVKADLERRGKKLTAEIESRGKALEAELQKYRAKGETMTQEEYQMAQQDLMQKEQAIMQYRDEEAEKLAYEEQRLLENLNNTVLKFIKTNYKDKGYQFILGYTKGGTIMYANDSLDITKSVINGLNEEYNKKKKK